MDKFKIAKFIIGYGVGSSTAYCATNVVINNLEPESTKEKIQTCVGAAMMSALVVREVKEYTNDLIDSVEEAWNKFQVEKNKPK